MSPRAGKQIAFVANAGPSGLEIWALESFLPAANQGTRTVGSKRD